MKITNEKLSQPYKFIVVEDVESLKVRKKKAYNIIKKDLPEVPGYRKGHVPQEIAEKQFGMKHLYTSIIDDIYFDVEDEYSIVSATDFKYYGQFKDDELKIEFIGEISPKIELPDLKSLEIEDTRSEEVTEEEVTEFINKELKAKKHLEEIEKEEIENLDVVVIDFEGTLENESKPFKGGTATKYELQVNTEKTTFIDNFEEQILGMKKGEVREVNVKFPETYPDENTRNKNVTFKVTLHSINKYVDLKLDDSFANIKGFETVDEYKKFIYDKLVDDKIRISSEDFKKTITTTLLEKTKFDPIPLSMIDNEFENQWSSYLVRMGKTEEELIKENKNVKEAYRLNSYKLTIDTIKANLVLHEIADNYSITVNEEEVIEYSNKVFAILDYDDKKKKKLFNDLEKTENRYQKKRMYGSATNEKTVNFLVELYANKSSI